MDNYRKMRKCRFTMKLRRKMTTTEILLWEKLRNRRFKGIKFRRQVNIGPYIADFLCKQHRLIIEVDGKSHDDKKEYDEKRDTFLNEHGYSVLRIKNEDVCNDIDDVLKKIYNSIYSQQSSPSPVHQGKDK